MARQHASDRAHGYSQFCKHLQRSHIDGTGPGATFKHPAPSQTMLPPDNIHIASAIHSFACDAQCRRTMAPRTSKPDANHIEKNLDGPPCRVGLLHRTRWGLHKCSSGPTLSNAPSRRRWLRRWGTAGRGAKNITKTLVEQEGS